MPRKSVSSLSVVPVVPGQGHPEPPSELDELEGRIWRNIVDALPSHWIDQAGQQILRRAVAQAAHCERLEERLRALRAAGLEYGEDIEALVVAHANTAKTMAQLLAALRVTPQSQMRSRAAVRQDRMPQSRPWEIKADGAA
jgi:hypothetical protein